MVADQICFNRQQDYVCIVKNNTGTHLIGYCVGITAVLEGLQKIKSLVFSGIRNQHCPTSKQFENIKTRSSLESCYLVPILILSFLPLLRISLCLVPSDFHAKTPRVFISTPLHANLSYVCECNIGFNLCGRLIRGLVCLEGLGKCC